MGKAHRSIKRSAGKAKDRSQLDQAVALEERALRENWTDDRLDQELATIGIPTIDPSQVTLTTDAEGHFEHIRRCPDCIDALMEWSKPMFYARGEPGGRVRKDLDAFIRQAKLKSRHR
jgi:hypothetical protein